MSSSLTVGSCQHTYSRVLIIVVENAGREISDVYGAMLRFDWLLHYELQTAIAHRHILNGMHFPYQQCNTRFEPNKPSIILGMTCQVFFGIVIVIVEVYLAHQS